LGYEKLNKEVSEWMKEDFIMLKNELDDIILLIRFYEISSIDFYDKIKPYKKIFNKEIYEELLQYQVTGRCQPRFILQKGPRSKTAIRTGQLLNSQTKYLISSWIDCKNNLYNEDNTPYKFELIFQGSQDGFTRSAFEDKCYNIKETATILKIKKTGELIGGYNPVGWNKEERSSNDLYYIESDKSFIFKIGQSDTILSRVQNSQQAFYHYSDEMAESILSFGGDLFVGYNITESHYYHYFFNNCSVYINNLNIRGSGLLDEFEIYKIIRKN